MILKKKDIRIVVVGLGYVGLPIAIELAKNFKVYGFDVRKKRVKDLISNKDETCEITSKILKKTKVVFSYKKEILKKANIFIVTIPTPVNKKNLPDLSLLKKATKMIAKNLKKNSLVIYESTVYPGCTEEVCLPILNKNNKLKYNKDFYIGYSPERINPGDKKKKISNIVKVVSGSSIEALDTIKYLYSKIVKSGFHIAPSIKFAEAAKIIEYSQRDLNIGLMNELFLFFDKLKIPTKDVLKATGTKWNFLNFKPGLVGGHCSVDPYYLTYKCKEVNFKPNIILSGRKINDNFHKFIADKSLSIIKNNNLKKKILILGYSFKENCPDYRNTRVFFLVKYLKKKKCNVHIHDPYFSKNTNDISFKNLFINKLQNTNQKYDLIILAVPHKEYLVNQNIMIKLLSKKGILYDFKAALKKNSKIIQN